MMMFDRKPNELATPATDDPSILLVGNPVPDVVRLPPELGGEIVKVTDAFLAPEPDTGAGRVRHLELDGGRFFVAETNRGFLWYQRKDKE